MLHMCIYVNMYIYIYIHMHKSSIYVSTVSDSKVLKNVGLEFGGGGGGGVRNRPGSTQASHPAKLTWMAYCMPGKGFRV